MICKIRDINFVHNLTGSTSPVFSCPELAWHRGREDTPVVVLTDRMVQSVEDSPQDVRYCAWILEPYAIDSYPYQYVLQNPDRFARVFTHHHKFIAKLPPGLGVYVPFGTSWIKEEDWKSHEKTKSVSILASGKTQTVGHRLRHKVVQTCQGKIDAFGQAAGRPLVDKADALREYRFHVAIENCREPGYFSEKLIDCFATKTVPIYWGDLRIADHFNIGGIIRLESLAHIQAVVKDLEKVGTNVYENSLSAIEDNFERAKNYRTAEQQLWPKLKEICDGQGD